MPQNMIDRFRKWFEYEKDAHAKVVRSLESVPSEKRESPEYRKAVAILAHIAAARGVWLGRLGVIALPSGPMFPEGAELADVAHRLGGVHDLWTNYLAGLTDEELRRTFEYQSLDAGRFRNCVEDILAQLFGHSSYHRGQIASLVRAAGGEPAATDYIFWCREPATQD
jgi:uncharacterized damage-inducible protein DinB